MTDAIKIDVWSDIACPWCFIGKRNLENGLAATADDDDAPVVEIEYHSFELSPDTPVDFVGGEVDYLSRHKGISPEQAREMLDRVTGVAAEAGLEYRFDLLQHTNTVKAHELLHFAKEQGRQLDLSERLMAAYFLEGKHVGRDDDLVELAVEVGLIKELQHAERLTEGNSTLTLTMCVNYGGRVEIVDAMRRIGEDIAAGKLKPSAVTEKLIRKNLYQPDMPDVDLFVRSSGEQRTSNFLLWESAYAEMVFLDTLWPDFRRTHLWDAIGRYLSRDRRFGGAVDTPDAK